MTPDTTNDPETVEEKDGEGGPAAKISGFGQKILGTIENIGGVLTGDPITQAEGEYNAEVGDVRENLEDDLENNNQ